MARRKRDLQTYLDSAQELFPYVPKLRRFIRRKRLKPWEKSYIARVENIVRQSYTNLDDLVPLTKKQAKDLKGFTYEPELIAKTGPRAGQPQHFHMFRAMQLRNVGEDVRILKVDKDKLVVESNNRTWIYWKLPPSNTSPEDMEEAGEEAFDMAEDEIERIIALTERAFNNPKTKLVYLWTQHGRVGIPMRRVADFIRWIAKKYSEYQQTERWVNGIAILVADADEKVTDREIATFTPSYEDRQERAKERRKLWRSRKPRKRSKRQ